MERAEAQIAEGSNILVVSGALADVSLTRDFCGSVVTLDDLSSERPDLTRKAVYLCGDISRVGADDLRAAERVLVIRELSHGYNEADGVAAWTTVDLGRVPLRVHGVGVYYRRFFDPGADHFTRIRTEHTFQSLTESTKPGKAHRTGIYLTPVREDG
ncbi:MAG: hypothetical protein ABI193_20265, partial [Minicystis sp.]